MISIFRKVIDSRVDERIKEIINSGKSFEFRDISEEEAKKEISLFIMENKNNGVARLSTLDFVLSLRIPAPQVEKILDIFVKENKIKELNV